MKNNKAKIIISILVFIMTLVNVILFNVYALEETEKKIANTEVYYDVYFGTDDNKKNEAKCDIDQSATLNIEINVKDGYLKESEISLENTNFNLISTSSQYVKSIDTKNNKLKLKQISKLQKVTIGVSISFKKGENSFNINDLNKETKVVLNGTYVNNKGTEVKIKNEERIIKLHPFKNLENYEANIKKEITKYIENEDSIILEEEIESCIVNKEDKDNSYNCLPIKETVLTINAPEINGLKPEEINVYVDSSKATNGKVNTQINGQEGIYKKENNIVTVTFKNEPDENGNVYWNKYAEDKVTITYKYAKEAKGTEKVDNNIASKIEVYNYKEKETDSSSLSTNNNNQIALEKKGKEISIEISTDSSLNKGYLYGVEKKLEYKENYSIDVSYLNNEKIEIKSENDKFLDENNLELFDAESYYTKTIIDKNNLFDILGEDGELKIYDENNSLLKTINKNTETSDNNKIIVEYAKVKGIKINTTKPTKIGKIEIENEKYITNTKLAKENIVKIKKLKNSVTNITTSFTYGNRTILEEPKTNFNVNMINDSLVAKEENKNFVFQIELIAKNGDDKLFENPEIKIQLPNYIKDVKISKDTVNVVYREELKVEEVEFNNETKIVTIKLEGTQTEHNSNNAIVQVYADILLDNTTVKEDTIKLEIDGVNKDLPLEIKTESENSDSNSNETENKNTEPIKDDEIRLEKQFEKIKVKVRTSANGKIIKASDTVKEGQYINYTVEITNTSSEKLTNIDLKLTGENGKYYTLERTGHDATWEEEQLTDESGMDFGLRKLAELASDEKIIDELEPNKTATITYTMVVAEDAENKVLSSNVQIIQDSKEIGTMIINNNITSAKLKLTVRYGHSDNLDAVAKDLFIIKIFVKNISDKKLNNVVISLKLPENLKINNDSVYEEDKEHNNYDDKKLEGNTVIYTINEIEPGKENEILLVTDVEMDVNLDEIQVNLQANAKVDNEEYLSNEFIKTIYQDIYLLSAMQEGSIKEDVVNDEEKLVYTFTIVNKGKETVENIEFSDILPDGVRLEDIIVKQNNKETQYDLTSISYANIDEISLKPGEKIIIELYTKIKLSDITDNSKQITNNAVISSGNMEPIKTNSITYKINTEGKTNNSAENLDNENSNYNNNSNNQNNDPSYNYEDENKNNSISGLAWLDENKNGSRETSEELLSGIRVILVDADNKKEIKDFITSANGRYVFTEVPNGRYVIKFEFDDTTYSPTIYKKTNVQSDLNSDVIETKDEYGNKKVTTDTLVVNNNTIKNIDIGLIKKDIFDFKLDKYISSITLQNKQGTKTYKYGNQKLAKIEIPAKYMEGSNLIIEYTIAVTNEGAISGYVKNIADYIPNDIKFNSELNKEWYVLPDGYAYNTSLKDSMINPGETKEVKIVLTKTITNADSELITNIAEIYEDYNNLGVEDIDSKAGNEIQDEDDISTAEVIISIKTGEIIRNIIIVIFILGVFTIGIYKIIKINNGREKENE